MSAAQDARKWCRHRHRRMAAEAAALLAPCRCPGAGAAMLGERSASGVGSAGARHAVTAAPRLLLLTR